MPTRGSAAGDDLKRDLAGIPLLFVMCNDLKRDMAQIPLLFVCMLEFRCPPAKGIYFSQRALRKTKFLRPSRRPRTTYQPERSIIPGSRVQDTIEKYSKTPNFGKACQNMVLGKKGCILPKTFEL